MPEQAKATRVVRPAPERIAESLQNVPTMRLVVETLVKADRECAAMLRDKLIAALGQQTSTRGPS